MVSKGFKERTTLRGGEGITISQPSGGLPGTGKHLVGIDHKPTGDEALQMGRELFDAISSEQAKIARSKENA